MLPVIVYTPEPEGRRPLHALAEFWRDVVAGRELAWRLFVRDLRAQYRLTYLGYVWALLPSLVASLTFIFLNSQGITNIQTGGMPYAAFAITGTLLWQTFVDALQSPLQSIAAAKPMLSKVNFPREAILIGGLYMVGFNTLVRLIVLAVVMAAWSLAPGPGLPLFPVALLALVLAGFSLGVLLTPLGTLYQDVARSLTVVTGFWMLLTPVVYPSRTGGLLGVLSTWNPVSPLVTTAREALTSEAFSQLPTFIALGAATLVVWVVAMSIFRIVMPRLIERMGG